MTRGSISASVGTTLGNRPRPPERPPRGRRTAAGGGRRRPPNSETGHVGSPGRCPRAQIGLKLPGQKKGPSQSSIARPASYIYPPCFRRTPLVARGVGNPTQGAAASAPSGRRAQEGGRGGESGFDVTDGLAKWPK